MLVTPGSERVIKHNESKKKTEQNKKRSCESASSHQTFVHYFLSLFWAFYYQNAWNLSPGITKLP